MNTIIAFDSFLFDIYLFQNIRKGRLLFMPAVRQFNYILYLFFFVENSVSSKNVVGGGEVKCKLKLRFWLN